jgi:hypothetical protein
MYVLLRLLIFPVTLWEQVTPTPTELRRLRNYTEAKGAAKGHVLWQLRMAEYLGAVGLQPKARGTVSPRPA